MKVVVALGGTALAKRGEALETDVQRQNVARAAAAVAAIARTHEVIVTHGNSPQVGLLAMMAESYAGVHPYPLDVLVAESEGMIGYLIEQELRNLLPGRHIATLLTQTEVSRTDVAFRHPSKPIGPGFTQEEAERLANERGWKIAQDGAKWRRVVPSPEPLRILELGAIKLLVSTGVVVVCAGGGGIPVTVSSTGVVRGVEAVIDKDLAAALLAHQVGADALLLLTDVGSVYTNWKQKDAQPIHETSSKELRNHTFAAGSMRPKVEAACRFIETGGAFAGIGLLEDAAAILLGRRGTIVRRPESTLDFTGGPQAMPKQAAAAGGKKRGKTATIVARFSAGGSRGIARGCVTRAEPRMPLPRAWIRPNTAATTSSSAARARTISKICRWICRSMN